jgi:tetratricopeptide (TPR) repeat protein/serine phosphatase RsbU (regulator of sigma subunit)
MIKKYFFSFLIICIFFQGYSQNAKIDSLENLLSKAVLDTAKASLMAQIGWEYKLSDPEKAKQLGEKALNLSLKTKYEPSEAASYNLLGVYYYLQHDYIHGRNYFEKALSLYKKLNNIKGIGSCYSNIANILSEQASFDSAIVYQELALKYRMKLKNEKPIADSYTNLGNIYNLKGDYALAAENLFKALKVYEKLNDTYGLGMCYYNIARTFYMQEKQDEAIMYVKKSREERTKLGDKSGIATTYLLEGSANERLKKYKEAAAAVNKAIVIEKEINDIYNLQYSYTVLANIFYNYQQFDLALDYYLKAREIAVQTNNVQAIANIDFSIGSIYQSKGNNTKALEYQLNALKISREIKAKEELKNSLLALSQTYTKMKNYEKALEYQNEFISLKDSMLNEANTKTLNQLQTQFESDKKQKEIELLTKDKVISDERIARQNIITYTVITGLFLVLILAFISFKRYREKKKANIEITIQKEVIEEKNKEILDSIHYAKRIQGALLASDSLLKKNLPEFFVLYKPKDIVSGDFYWASEVGQKNQDTRTMVLDVGKNVSKNDNANSLFLLATCDCTGHGVPGAFMSLLNISKLNETVIERKISQPDLILNQVRDEIIKALNPDGADKNAKDGMDAVLCAFNFNSMKLQFAAANNPLILVRHNELLEYKADKFPVGMHQGEHKPFTLQTIDLQKGDCIYTFTDGFSDQFGGDKGKKLMSKNFKNILLTESQFPFEKQKEDLNILFEKWRGSHEQIDDVLVIGVRV